MKNKLYLVFTILFCIATLFMGVGYASINSISLNMNGKVNPQLQNGIFITEANFNPNDSLACDILETNVILAEQTILNSKVALSDTNPKSTAVFDVTIYNGTDTLYLFDGVTYDFEFYTNNNIIFEIIDFDIGDMLAPNEFATFKVKFHYLNDTIVDGKNKNILESFLKFNFELEHFRWDSYQYNGFDVIEILESSSNNLKMKLSPILGDWDRFIIPIDNLEVGSYYSISFTEHKELLSGKTYINDANMYAYGTTVTLKETHENIGALKQSFILPKYFNYDNDPKHTAFMWKEPFLEDGYVEENTYDVGLTFYAAEETMYWLWDFANIENNCELVFDLTDIKIQKVNYPKDKAYIRFADTSYNEWVYDIDYDDDGVDDEQNYLKYSYRTNATETDLDLRIETGIGWETFNIPIKNLNIGKKYKIFYTVNTAPAGIKINTSNVYGNYIRNSAYTEYRGSQQISLDNASNADVSVINKTGNFSDSLEFTATAETMYWVWQCGGINNYQWANIKISNAVLEEVAS